MQFKFSFIVENITDVLGAVPVTLALTFIPAVLGLVLGFFLALARIKRIPVLNTLITLYSSFFRSVPLLVLLFLAYYGTPKLVNFLFYGGYRVMSPAQMSSFGTALTIMLLYAGAMLCEIIRGALSSVDMKQMEAAHAIGMNRVQSYFHIIIPQAVIVALPNYFNFVLALLKGSSVVFTISVMDMMNVAKLSAEINYRYVEAYVLVGVMYIIVSLILSAVFRRVEYAARRHLGMA